MYTRSFHDLLVGIATFIVFLIGLYLLDPALYYGFINILKQLMTVIEDLLTGLTQNGF